MAQLPRQCFDFLLIHPLHLKHWSYTAKIEPSTTFPPRSSCCNPRNGTDIMARQIFFFAVIPSHDEKCTGGTHEKKSPARRATWPPACATVTRFISTWPLLRCCTSPTTRPPAPAPCAPPPAATSPSPSSPSSPAAATSCPPSPPASWP
uniref:Uncharacterized protein n=1 Tax=Oryza brachyantha TaxID=4533 RepID=J3LYZ4_ORYBR